MNKIQKVLDLFELSELKYFITGSRKFGVETDESDYDICVNHFHLSKVDKILELLNITEKIYGKSSSSSKNRLLGYKINYEGNIINIIPVTKREYDIWFTATELMVSLIKDNENYHKKIKDKKIRVRCFEELMGVGEILND